MNKKTKIAIMVIRKFISNVLGEQKMRLYDFNIALKAICVIAFEYGFNIGNLLDKEENNAGNT